MATTHQKVQNTLIEGFVKDVKFLAKEHQIELDDIISALGIDLKTFERWDNGHQAYPKSLFLVLERWKRLKVFFAEADQAISSKQMPIWLNTPDPRLLGFTPIKCLTTPEGFLKVSKLVHAFRWGLP